MIEQPQTEIVDGTSIEFQVFDNAFALNPGRERFRLVANSVVKGKRYWICHPFEQSGELEGLKACIAAKFRELHEN